MRVLGYIALVFGAGIFLLPNILGGQYLGVSGLWQLRNFIFFQCCMIAGISFQRDPQPGRGRAVFAAVAVMTLTVLLVKPENFTLGVLLLAFGIQAILLWLIQRREKYRV